MEMEVLVKPASGVGTRPPALLTCCLLRFQILTLQAHPAQQLSNRLAAEGQCLRPAYGMGLGRPSPQDPGDTPTSASTRASVLCPGF